MAFPLLSQLFPSVYKLETHFCLVLGCFPKFRNQNLSLFSILSSTSKLSQNHEVPWDSSGFPKHQLNKSSVRVTMKLMASSLIVSWSLTTWGLTHEDTAVEAFFIFIKTLFEQQNWCVRHQSVPVLFRSKLRMFWQRHCPGQVFTYIYGNRDHIHSDVYV